MKVLAVVVKVFRRETLAHLQWLSRGYGGNTCVAQPVRLRYRNPPGAGILVPG
jgi:hypothetical protein